MFFLRSFHLFIYTGLIAFPFLWAENFLLLVRYGEYVYQVVFYELAYYISTLFFFSVFYFIFLEKGKIGKKNVTDVKDILFKYFISKKYLSVFLFLLGFFLLILVSYLGVGIQEWLNSPRFMYQYGRKGLGPIYALAMMMFGLGYTGILCALLNRGIVLWILVLLLGVVVAYFYGQRMFLVEVFFAWCLFFSLRFRWNFFILFVIFAYILIILIVPLYLNENLVDYLIKMHFPHALNSVSVVEDLKKGGVDFFYGEILFSEIWKLVPRSIYPDKPYEYGVLLLNGIYFPGMAEKTHTPAFSNFVSSYADWGLFGILFSGLSLKVIFFSYCAAIYDSARRCSLLLASFLSMYFILLSPGYLNFLPNWTVVIITMIVFKLIYFSSVDKDFRSKEEL
ncbi:MAG: hypothetical protein JXR18_12210 [Neptuniibacter sp.]